MVSWSSLARGTRFEERQLRLAGIAVVALVATVALAGCAGIGGGSGQSLSDAQVGVSEDGSPAVAFNYSVNDYATVLLEGPNDNIINEREVSPAGEQSALYMGDPQPGEYKLVLRQGDSTVTSTMMTFEGSDPEVEEVSPKWSGNTIQSVEVTVRNAGDLPAYVNNATYSARGSSVESSVYGWVDAGESRTFNVTTSFGGSISITEAGDVTGSVEVVTNNGTLAGSFSKTFEGPKLSIEQANATWGSSDLELVTATVTNTGDLPTDANISVRRGGESLATTFDKTVPPGESASFEVETLGSLFSADSGGTVNFDVVANLPEGFVTETLTHEIAGADVTIESVTPSWENGELTSVTVEVSNNGDVQAEGTAEVAVDGSSVTSSSFYVDPGETGSFDITGGFDALYTASSGGSHDVEVTIQGDSGDWTDTSTSTTDLGSYGGDISSISGTFYGNYGESTSDLSSLEFTVRNTGDVSLNYDTIEVSMAGATQTVNANSFGLSPGESTTEYARPDMTVENGKHDVTIRLLSDGEEVASGTGTVST